MSVRVRACACACGCAYGCACMCCAHAKKQDAGLVPAGQGLADAHAARPTCCRAAEHVRRGDADLMLAGAADAAIIPSGIGGFIACKVRCGAGGPPCRHTGYPCTHARGWHGALGVVLQWASAGATLACLILQAHKNGIPQLPTPQPPPVVAWRMGGCAPMSKCWRHPGAFLPSGPQERCAPAAHTPAHTPAPLTHMPHPHRR